jgi:peroxiredoxin
MRNNLRANLELSAQIAIAIAIVAVAGVLVKRNLFPSSNLTRPPQINAGEKLNVPNVDWEHNGKSLVFFLRKDCKYCTSSAPFYRQLIADANARNVKLLAILPNSLDDARQYLKSLDLAIDDVRSSSFAEYKINGTPTVLFVDNEGIVRRTWFGAQSDREGEMRNQLAQLFAGGD